MLTLVRRRAVLAAGAAALVVLAGCGDDGADFATEADRICEDRVALFERADRGGDINNQVIADAYEKELARLRDLEPPENKAAGFRRLLELYDERTRTQREVADLEDAIEQATSRAEYGRLSERLSRVFTDANRARVRGNRAARDLGLKVCGRTLS